MSEQAGSTPRRALPPRDESREDGSPHNESPLDDPPHEDQHDQPQDDQPQDESLESDSPTAGAGDGEDSALRTWSSTGARPDAAGTPIPPPAVLPSPEVPPASAGRRFSAVDLPLDEDRPLPRRSALSPAATRARSPESPSDGADPAPPSPARRRPWLIGLGVAALAGALVLFFLWQPGGALGPSATPTPTIDPVATYLLQPADLAGISPETAWDAATTATEVSATTPQAKCVLPASETEPAAADSMVRTFAPTGGQPGAMLHQVDTYVTAEEAQAAYEQRVAQLADCTRNTVLVSSGVLVEGLADQASGVRLVMQDAQPEYHTILVGRTGTRVNVVDATHPADFVQPATLAPALATVASRQCAAGGTCPTQVAVSDAVPPVTEPPGWLASVDLPRITSGSGQWRGTAEVKPTIDVTGTRCEAIELADVGGATASLQRTYLLQDDTRAPANFGVDELLYIFSTPEEANALVATLSGNIDGCAGRTATAQVARSGDVSGAGTGAAWVVTQKVDQAAATARFRNAVVAVGNRVVYLLANPTNEFDFSDEAWHAVARRAAERATQLP